MEFDDILLETQDLMEKAVSHATQEFSKIHTGKATPSMIENLNVHVESYGTSMALKEMAAITTPDSRTLQVQPWDKSTLEPIDKAIRTANLGLNPISRGAAILVPIPELSGDRRKELVKITSSHAEDGRISVRKARHFAMDALKKLKDESSVSEDDIKRHEKEIQDETDSAIEKINQALEAKEKELLSI